MIITADSHLDHGLTKIQIDHITTTFAERLGFFIATIELPEELGTVPCDLHGPATGERPVPGEECKLVTRGARTWPSRLCARPPVQTRMVTVIAGPHGDDQCVLFTAYGGPLAPKEPGDPTLTDDQREASVAFWADHALGGE
jgi:hypothetical protein